MKRSLSRFIQKDLNDKLVFITGPRQVGKTTLAKSLMSDYDYFNYDLGEHRLALKEQSWDRTKPLVIFDELHKMRRWKQWLKGIYDTAGVRPRLLITGSAKLNTYRKVGDSLAGRYFQYRLHPLDLKEVRSIYSPQEAFDRLWDCSGFPEPFLKGEPTYYNRWKRSHLDIILRQDLIDLQSVRDIQAVETLMVLLKENVGSPISYANLARTLERDATTIKRWLRLLEELYVIFKVTPYSKHIARSLLKEPKYYFFDFARVSDQGARLENIVASGILKELNFMEDTLGVDAKLYYVRTKDGKEIDFLVCIDNKPSSLIEVKYSDDQPSKQFKHFEDYFLGIPKIQLVRTLNREKTYPNGIEIRSVISWLSTIHFASQA